MQATANDPWILFISAVIGFLAAAGLLWLAALRPLHAQSQAKTILLAAATSDLTNERIAMATLRSELLTTTSALAEAKESYLTTLRELACSAARVSDLERQIATSDATLAQMKLGERDVEERLQRVASTYVAEARETLVKAAAERFDGDASAFREKLIASVAPLNERIESLGKSLTDLGTARTAEEAKVATLLAGLSEKMAGIDNATRRVERVLGNSQARGSWGEFELTRILELTGMTEHVSFETQAAGYGADESGRPDAVLFVPGNMIVPIDAKVPFARYQDAVAAASEAEREPLLDEAVRAIRAHVKVLGTRKYHARPDCVGWTIMFVPIEAMLATLFARDRDLFDLAREARVLIASPLTLMLYLEAFSRGWAAQKQSENASHILDEARTLVSRLATFTDKFAKLGSTLNTALDRYNDAVGTYESRIGPQARKILALRGETTEAEELEEQPGHARPIDITRLPSAYALESA